MIHPDTELRFISNEIGYGVVATKFIPAGTITWVLDELDREFTPMELQQMAPIYQNILDTYTFRNNKGNYILCWDNGRYVNHSFNSNCLTTAYDFEIAIRDIQTGEQLTDDYGYLNIPIPFRAVDEGTRRKVVYPDDLLKYYKVWDNKIKKVFGTITKLQQPLRPILNEWLWEKIEDITSGKEEMDSILTNFYNGNVTV
ncbi:SET domain-containing protein [Flagellimonas aequoris]|uniref:SET domain-containing protein-lysine N-methyltransferase n=1 Tax=Flagellimonas aequoris TaxID=2306997 RepID=A0A418NC29_9FLAO|nr:SET domain-containing protein [Allomuricauda aequoris]RIV73770.1 SET domain-containing protein-lysine N-methyltransferase [Allomuricauda aequoris]TXK07454.1 SET domain-containing protein-lysine N-methyltransferase [Allomuricauda aequoris]